MQDNTASKFKKRGILLAIASASLLLVSGCTLTSYTSPTGEHFSRLAVGNKASAGAIDVTPNTNGLPTLHIKNLQSDSATLAGEVAEHTAAGIMKGLKGGQ